MAKIIYGVTIVFMMMENGFSQKIAKDMCSEFVNQKLSSPQIRGGNATRENEFPHMVALGYGSSRDPLWLCGGTLISDQFILTAAHCTSLQNVGSVKTVRLGTRTLNSRRGQTYDDIKVARIIRHPEYNPPSSYNDLALLKLQRKVRFSKNILPACLNSAFNVNLATKTLLALGWGTMDFDGPSDDELMKVELRVIQDRECDRSYRRTSRNTLPQGVNDEVQLCARGDFERGTCLDDSGGPLEYRNGKFHYIVGITSMGKTCGISRTPGVFTRVSAFVPWIESEVWL